MDIRKTGEEGAAARVFSFFYFFLIFNFFSSRVEIYCIYFFLFLVCIGQYEETNDLENDKM